MTKQKQTNPQSVDGKKSLSTEINLKNKQKKCISETYLVFWQQKLANLEPNLPKEIQKNHISKLGDGKKTITTDINEIHKTTSCYLKKHIFCYIGKSKRDEFFRRKMTKVRQTSLIGIKMTVVIKNLPTKASQKSSSQARFTGELN